jgi:hypothetical protein
MPGDSRDVGSSGFAVEGRTANREVEISPTAVCFWKVDRGSATDNDNYRVTIYRLKAALRRLFLARRFLLGIQVARVVDRVPILAD